MIITIIIIIIILNTAWTQLKSSVSWRNISRALVLEIRSRIEAILLLMRFDSHSHPFLSFYLIILMSS